MTISVQFGYGNYCENRDTRNAGNLFASHDAHERDCESKDAEVAAWIDIDGNRGEWITKKLIDGLDYDDVKGWMSADEVGAFIARAMGFVVTPAMLAVDSNEANEVSVDGGES